MADPIVAREWRDMCYAHGGCTTYLETEHNALRLAYIARCAEQQATQRLAEDWAAKAGDYLARNAASRERYEASEARCAALVKALILVRSIITEGAMTGFNPKDGDWATRLFESQGVTVEALKERT